MFKNVLSNSQGKECISIVKLIVEYALGWQFLVTFAYQLQVPIGFIIPVRTAACLSASMYSHSTGQICVKYDIGHVY
jgi:hypothetical protein